MKKLLFLLNLISVVSMFFSCGPAAEDREAMYARAKVFQDSIANVIRTALDETRELTKWPYIQQAQKDTTAKKDSTPVQKK
jgi:hypothetical protein